MAFNVGDLLNPNAGFWQAFSDPNNLKMLAQMGAGLGAGGVGEAIGVPTANAITSEQMQQALQGMFGGTKPTLSTTVKPSAATAKNPVSMRDQKGAGLTGTQAATMGGEATSGLADFGGFTPPDQEGVTGMKMKPDGSITMDFTPKRQGAQEGTANASPFMQRLLGMALYQGQ